MTQGTLIPLLTTGLLVMSGCADALGPEQAQAPEVAMSVVPSGTSIPPQCSKFVPGGPNTNHTAGSFNFQGTPKSTFGSGESVNVKVSVSSSVGDTDSNRVRVVWFNPQNVAVAVSVLPRGTQSSTSWNVTAGLTTGSSGSTNPSGSWMAIACYETPNNAKGKGVTHHIDQVTFTVI